MSCYWRRGEEMTVGEIDRELRQACRTIEKRPGTPRARAAETRIANLRERKRKALEDLDRHLAYDECEACR